MNKENIEIIFKQAKKYYLETENVSIKLKFTPLYYSTMTSRPKIILFLFPWLKRNYVISVNSSEKYKKFAIPLSILNDSILLGWIGHELAHIIQYEKMGKKEIMSFPFKYGLNKKFRKNFETEADEITKQRGLEKELKEGINFVLTNTKISTAYKNRLKKFYSQI
ncbi:MAG: hypothetical protein WCG45_00050 [bacterium]